MALEFDRSILGREFDRSEYGPVTQGEMQAFAQALGETGSEYLDPDEAAQGPAGGLVAVPTFCLKFRSKRFYPPDIPALPRNGMDAGKDVVFGVPIRPGDTITVSAALQELYEKTGRSGSMVFVVIRFTLTNQRSEMVAIVDNRFMHREFRSSEAGS